MTATSPKGGRSFTAYEKTVTPPCNHNGRQGSRWSREQIRAARLAPLVPLLQKRGIQLIVSVPSSASFQADHNRHSVML